MNPEIPKTMKAVALDHYGGPEVLLTRSMTVPEPGNDEVLIRLETAGIGVWDAAVRAGELEFFKPSFPKVIGNDGAGTVVAVGKNVKRAKVGDRVYAYGYEGGFYAEYVKVKEEEVALIPENLPTDEAGALGADGVTALIGLEDKLNLDQGQSLLIYGASGGIGHLAVQLAKRMGARVLGIASGADGVALVKRLGADEAVDGKEGDVAEAVRRFAPDGVDAALVLTDGKTLKDALDGVKEDGLVAHPNGVFPVPKGRPGLKVIAYDGESSRDTLERLSRLIAMGPFHVELGQTFSLDEAVKAHQLLGQHHLGKLALRIH